MVLSTLDNKILDIGILYYGFCKKLCLYYISGGSVPCKGFSLLVLRSTDFGSIGTNVGKSYTVQYKICV